MDRQKININGRKCNKNNTSYNNNNNSIININNHNNNIKYGQKNNGLEWTNERHSKFLSSMEESFVQNMLEKSSDIININTTVTSKKLDRFVPDISESTLDVSSSAYSSNGMRRTCNKHKKVHVIRSRKMVRDQVVPELEERVGDKGSDEFDLNK